MKSPLVAATVLLSTTSALHLRIPFSDSDQQPLGFLDNLFGGEDSKDGSSSSSSYKKKPLVDSEALQAGIKVPRLLGHARALFGIAQSAIGEYGHPTRVIGSAGHTGTVDYIYSIVSSLGGGKGGKGGYYRVWNQTFPAVTGKVYQSRLVLNDTVPASASAMSLTPPTPDNEPVFGQLVLVDGHGCEEADYPATVAGAIAIVQRGVCSFGAKSLLAGEAGAVAVVVYNNEEGGLSGTLGTPIKGQVATFGVSGAEAAGIVAALQKGATLDGIAFIDSVVSVIQTTNVLAQTVEGDPDNCVMLGGHSDSVEAGPGINDDGSGSLTLLEVATQLVRFRVNNCVRFAWWAAEEEGLLGSDYYAMTLPAEENLKVRLFMDYDMMASPNFAYEIYDARDADNPAGSEALRNLYMDWYTAHGLPYKMVPFDGRSDYDGFIRAGIPAGGIATGAEGVKTADEAVLFGGKAGDWYDPCYHQLCDDISNLNLTAWEVNTKLVAHSVATFAASFEGFPERTIDSLTATSYGDEHKYHGRKLIM